MTQMTYNQTIFFPYFTVLYIQTTVAFSCNRLVSSITL